MTAAPVHDRKPRRPLMKTLRNLALGLPMLVMTVAAEGDCELDWFTLRSPVQALTTVFVEPDGRVVAELTLISTQDRQDARWADGATKVELRVPDGTLVTLEPVGEGRYRADSATHPELLWMPGERYRVTFEFEDVDLAGDYAGEEFLAVVDAPADEIAFSLDHAPAFVGDTAELSWRSRELDALIDVYGPSGELIFTTFDWSHPEFDGSKWGSLARSGEHTLPVDVFDEPGSYTITACVAMTQEGFDAELSAALGPASGFIAGACFDAIELDVSE